MDKLHTSILLGFVLAHLGFRWALRRSLEAFDDPAWHERFTLAAARRPRWRSALVFVLFAIVLALSLIDTDVTAALWGFYGAVAIAWVTGGVLDNLWVRRQGAPATYVAVHAAQVVVYLAAIVALAATSLPR